MRVAQIKAHIPDSLEEKSAKDEYWTVWYDCTFCKDENVIAKDYNYCPKCGAQINWIEELKGERC